MADFMKRLLGPADYFTNGFGFWGNESTEIGTPGTSRKVFFRQTEYLFYQSELRSGTTEREIKKARDQHM
jgi:hypothetical protein